MFLRHLWAIAYSRKGKHGQTRCKEVKGCVDMKRILFLPLLLALFYLASPDSYAQCTSSDIMEPGFNFITSSRGCAPFEVQIQTQYLNSKPGTTYYVDWGDGNSDTYLQVNPNPNGPIIVHTYSNAPVACGYQVVIEVENACNPRGSVTLEPINVIVWTEDIIQSDPDVFRVCEGFASSINFQDASDWNCFPRPDLRENSDPRWIQWIYGRGANATRIPGIQVGGASPGAFPYYDPIFGTDPKYPVSGIVETSLSIDVPATAALGQDFYVTLNNWNTCNAYDENLTDSNPLNPATAGGDNAPRTSESRIVIVATPTPDFVAKKESNSGAVGWDYCIDDIVYFRNTSNGPGGAALAYTWEFFDGPNATDPLLGTRTATHPTFQFASGGHKLVRLTVVDNNATGGCNAIVEKIVRITPTAIAQIGTAKTSFCKTPGSGETFNVTFTDETVGSIPGIDEWRWEVYDEKNVLIKSVPAAANSFTDAAKVSVSQVYSEPGVYKTRLIYRDKVTKCDTQDEINIVIYHNPVPSFVSQAVCDGLPSGLMEKTTLEVINANKVVKWEWDFDYDMVTFDPDSVFDLTRPDTLMRSFSFGTHQVALRTTSDQNGCNAIFTMPIQVNQKPIATFTKDKVDGCSPLSVSFENTSTATQPVAIDQYVWCIDYGTGYIDTIFTDPNLAGYDPVMTTTFQNWSVLPKDFNVILKSVSKDGCLALSSADKVTVLPSVKPGFIYVDYEPLAKNCAPVEIGFQVDKATMSLLPQSYTWLVKQGSDTLLQTTTNGLAGLFKHTFQAKGKGINNFSVNLQSNIKDICVGDSTLFVNVNPVPTSDFTIDTVSLACEEMTIKVDAKHKGLMEYDWIIARGGVIYMNDTLDDSFIYKIKRPAPGADNLPVKIDLKTANYAFCESSTTTHSIIVPSQPQLMADFGVNPEFQVFPGATVTIDNLSTRSKPEYLWDFGDGTTSQEEFPAPHTYAKPGTYTISLNLKEKGCESVDSASIFIQPTAPEADFSFDPGKGCAPLTVNFTNLTRYGDPDSYRWNFGAGEGTSTKEHPSHTYYQPGIYSVKLEASNESGVTDAAVKSMIIEVFPVPHADFSIRPEKVKLPDDPIYTTNLSFDADLYFWEFGDGGKSTDFEPVYTYLDTGRFDITLIASTNNNCSDTVTYAKIVEVVDGNEIQIPNAFTPSLDGPTGGNRYNSGRNDVFFPVTEGVIAYKMQIFNRWGELLFYTEDTNKGWDGYYNNRLCAPDVYVYKLEFKFIDGRELTKFGDIALIR